MLEDVLGDDWMYGMLKGVGGDRLDVCQEMFWVRRCFGDDWMYVKMCIGDNRFRCCHSLLPF